MNLTDDDKKWFEALVAPFATKVELEGVEARLEAKLERSAAKADLERVETKPPAEFPKGPSPMEARQRAHSLNLHTIELEMELLSHRIKKLEGPRPS